MAEKKKLSVAEILAAARKADSGDKGADKVETAPEPEAPVAPAVAAESTAEPDVTGEAVESPTKTKTPAAKPKPAGGARLSVAEMLAAARAGGKGGEKKPAVAKPAAAAKPEAKPAAPKGAAAKPAEAKASEKAAEKPAKAGVPTASSKDTASILAAARTHIKPGPLSKAEAAARLTPESASPAAKPAKPLVPPMPAKPIMAKPKQPSAISEPSVEERRGVLAFLAGAGSLVAGSFLGIGFTSLSATLGLWTLGTARFMFPNVLVEPPSKFKVGFPSDFAPGQVEEKFKAQFGVWVAKAEYQGQLQIYALRTVCTHLGCTPNWLEGEQKFKCPCHGSGFYKDGINFEGPAPRPLERYAIRLADDGQLEIDKSKLFQQEMGQWNDPSSFVPA
jgi:cytochrome b6-f complex iron-sulfur subunit